MKQGEAGLLKLRSCPRSWDTAGKRMKKKRKHAVMCMVKQKSKQMGQWELGVRMQAYAWRGGEWQKVGEGRVVWASGRKEEQHLDGAQAW